jgi:hypothetical protein
MLAYVRTAALVVIVFLILALLSRMSAPEVQLDMSIQHGVRQLVSKSQEAHARANTSNHPVHYLLNLTEGLNYLDAAFTLTNPKYCKTITKCDVQELYNTLLQQQEAAALRFLVPVPPPPPAPMVTQPTPSPLYSVHQRQH